MKIIVKLTNLAFTAEERLVARLATRRGAGFLEYALLAAVALGIFFLINSLFPSFFRTIFRRLTDAINGVR